MNKKAANQLKAANVKEETGLQELEHLMASLELDGLELSAQEIHVEKLETRLSLNGGSGCIVYVHGDPVAKY